MRVRLCVCLGVSVGLQGWFRFVICCGLICRRLIWWFAVLGLIWVPFGLVGTWFDLVTFADGLGGLLVWVPVALWVTSFDVPPRSFGLGDSGFVCSLFRLPLSIVSRFDAGLL